jgi:hypothetical protein
MPDKPKEQIVAVLRKPRIYSGSIIRSFVFTTGDNKRSVGPQQPRLAI